MGFLLILMAIWMGVIFAVIWGLMAAARRWVHVYLSLAIGGISLLGIIHSVVTGMAFCAQEPEYIPPSEEAAAAGSDGRMVHNCDGPLGFLDHAYFYVYGPAFAVALGYLIYRYVRELRSPPSSAN